MKTKIDNSEKLRRGKFEAQMDRSFAAFREAPKTMLQVSVETGILRANLCRYVAKWRNQNRITRVRKGLCPISKHEAGFYQVNSELFGNE